MDIIGRDFRKRFQQIARLDTERAEAVAERLDPKRAFTRR